MVPINLELALHCKMIFSDAIKRMMERGLLDKLETRLGMQRWCRSVSFLALQC